uniref:VWFA domain-containing protein n=1 Tax=Labrus bergylta TaxID=56723 RepID=A0A3Q3FLR0_9LABR
MTLLISPFPTDCKAAKLADIVFIIDESGSIGTPNFQLVRAFLHSIVSGLDVGPKRVRVGIMSFADRPSALVHLNTFNDKNDLLKFIKILPYHGGGTNTRDALEYARKSVFIKEKGSRKDRGVQQVAVVITDGESQYNVSKAAYELRREGITVYAVGVKGANEDELKQMASYPTHKHTFVVDDFTKLKTLEQTLQKSMYICSPGGKKTALKFKMCVSLSAGDNLPVCCCPHRPYFLHTSKTSCKDQPGDLIFLIDSSGSIEYDDYQKMKDFMKSVIGKSIIGQNDVHVGVMQFSDRQTMEFPLNSFYSQDEMLQAIGDMIQFGGGTLTGEAITAVSQYFDVARGGRPNLKQRLVVITDGEAQDEVEGPAASLRANGVLVYGLYKNITQELCDVTNVCEKQRADLVFLIDYSGSIQQQDYTIMKNFTTEVISSFKISDDLVRVGCAQFSSEFKDEFYLNQWNTLETASKHIQKMIQSGGGTNIGKALDAIREYFEASRGSRRSEGISQNLVLITDGESQDDVEDAANRLRDLGIEVFAIGIGNVHDLELLQITGTPERLFTVQNFGSLENIKKKVVTYHANRSCCVRSGRRAVMLNRKSAFSKELQESYSFLPKVPANEYAAFCTNCKCLFSVAHRPDTQSRHTKPN